MAPVVEAKKERDIKVPVKQRSTTFVPPLEYKIVSDTEINLTKQKAFDFLELKTFEGERPVRERHVQFLFDEWSSNRFLWQNIIIASAKVVGQPAEYRINGQHTCWMRVNVPEKYEPLNCKVRHMIYSVKDEDQLRTLYSVFDRGAPRTSGHIGIVLLLGDPASDGIPKSMIGCLLSGFKLFWAGGTKRTNLSINDWCGIITNNYPAVFNVAGRWLSAHSNSDASKFMKRASVVGAVFSTFEKSVEAADEFWKPVADGVNLTNKHDPRYMLRNYLMTHGHSILRGTEKVSQEEMLYVCINMWNHWRDGKSVTKVHRVLDRPKVK